MDVLGILKKDGNNMLKEDLDLLTVELNTGDYDAGYVKACKEMISQIANWLNSSEGEEKTGGTETNDKPGKHESGQKVIPGNIIMSPEQLVPSGAKGIPVSPPIPPAKMVDGDLKRMRSDKDYKTIFKKYVRESEIINEAFVEKYFSLFEERELNAMLSCIQFSETFLEKYYHLLDPNAIALHQEFSESFFMKHYTDLDAETVLARGVNPWKDKAKRSKQLELFLRIKGVKL